MNILYIKGLKTQYFMYSKTGHRTSETIHLTIILVHNQETKLNRFQ